MNELLGRSVGRTLNQYHQGHCPDPLMKWKEANFPEGAWKAWRGQV